MPWNTEEKLMLFILLLREGHRTSNKAVLVIYGLPIPGHAALGERGKYVFIIAPMYPLLFIL